MKFTTIPKNGASWHDNLIYEFDSEIAEGADYTLSINDKSRGVVIGLVTLRNVTKAKVDIAPYIRRIMGTTPAMSTTPAVSISPVALVVNLSCNDIQSENRLIFRSEIKSLAPELYTRSVTRQIIRRNDPILLTAYGEEYVTVRVRYMHNNGSTTMEITHRTYGLPAEICVPTTSTNDTLRSVYLTITCDNAVTYERNYTIGEGLDNAVTLYWYNPMGGVDHYTFPLVRLQERYAEVESITTSTTTYRNLKSDRLTYTLTSAREVPEQMSQLAEIVGSPHIFCHLDGSLVEVEMPERKIVYDNHGALPLLQIKLTTNAKCRLL